MEKGERRWEMELWSLEVLILWFGGELFLGGFWLLNIGFGLVMSFCEVNGDTNGENGSLGVKFKGWRRWTVPTRALYLSGVRTARAVWGPSDPSTLRSREVSRKAPFSNKNKNEREDEKKKWGLLELRCLGIKDNEKNVEFIWKYEL